MGLEKPGTAPRTSRIADWLTAARNLMPRALSDARALRARLGALEDDLERVQAQRDQFREQRDAARRQRDQYCQQRDAARRERDIARNADTVVAPDVSGQQLAEERFKAYPPRHRRIGEHIAEVFERAGLKRGRILEIGGRENPYRDAFSGYEYTNLDLSETGPGVMLGDITSCPHIPDGSFDAVISVDVFEHIDRPWLAAREISRLLAPGGITYHSTLFSWRYHPCPIDYWRYTHDALRFLFDDLECIVAGFDEVERRRNILGKGRFKLVPDAFGGWRENWRVFYAGRKRA